MTVDLSVISYHRETRFVINAKEFVKALRFKFAN